MVTNNINGYWIIIAVAAPQASIDEEYFLGLRMHCAWWRNWLARLTVNQEAESSSLSRAGCFDIWLLKNWATPAAPTTLMDARPVISVCLFETQLLPRSQYIASRT